MLTNVYPRLTNILKNHTNVRNSGELETLEIALQVQFLVLGHCLGVNRLSYK